MSIQQTKKQSDLEKRLRIVRQQMYGKDSYSLNSESPITKSSTPLKSDTAYLYQDLLKISILSSLAIGSQILLLNLNLF
ncbi:hypothetical protein A3C59_05440 [Candidatus Daviesbacteria bacterium RIFCSPHIGHO2_02_FULL_36_13]|uniref:Uncharacterized protein n=1 Tax=Candidatus Daviesbacteria bacterium RIFCSPHIGHO2_02_FULL_36_13 TaxID=1797768 RepID=A0A1F5JZF2_9BACT|nr:MAG: hypothetical protein A3C59_05440 [Candidatus Daviesbacteria bacterium RIFCSPHIGHO2_02_FULL_36_13]